MAGESVEIQKIFTLGPKGTFSNQAATRVAHGRNLEIIYTTTIPQIAREVKEHPSFIGVLPIENSTSGTVGQSQDCLLETEIVITNELMIDVQYSLVSNVALDKIERYYCHSVAFNQTMLFTAKNLSGADVIFSNSNSHSGELFLKLPNEPIAAIIPKPLADNKEKFRTKRVETEIQDWEHNITRFLVIGKRETKYVPDFKKHKTSIYIELHEDRHSLLFEVLREFHVFGINLCRLESRPVKNKPWCYGFFIDFVNCYRTATCLDEIAKLDINYYLLGSYDPIEN